MVPRKKRQRYRTSAIKIAASIGLKIDANDWDQIWSLLDEHDEVKYIYAIYDIKNRLVKFGQSVSPWSRKSLSRIVTV